MPSGLPRIALAPSRGLRSLFCDAPSTTSARRHPAPFPKNTGALLRGRRFRLRRGRLAARPVEIERRLAGAPAIREGLDDKAAQPAQCRLGRQRMADDAAPGVGAAGYGAGLGRHGSGTPPAHHVGLVLAVAVVALAVAAVAAALEDAVLLFGGHAA